MPRKKQNIGPAGVPVKTRYLKKCGDPILEKAVVGFGDEVEHLVAPKHLPENVLKQLAKDEDDQLRAEVLAENPQSVEDKKAADREKRKQEIRDELAASGKSNGKGNSRKT